MNYYDMQHHQNTNQHGSQGYQNLYDRAKHIIKTNAVMAFYNEKKQLYLETDGSGVGLGSSLLQVKNRM